jgi:predicted transcriptional regulator
VNVLQPSMESARLDDVPKGLRPAASRKSLQQLSAGIVAAYVARNSLDSAELPRLVLHVGVTLASLRNSRLSIAAEKQHPAVPIRRSITPNYIICLEDGQKLKTLVRYLRVNFNMTPDQYREKWGLRPDYPMVAPNLSAMRSATAKKIGLGGSNSRHKRANV